MDGDLRPRELRLPNTLHAVGDAMGFVEIQVSIHLQVELGVDAGPG